MQLAKRGYVAICPDCRGFGERRDEALQKGTAVSYTHLLYLVLCAVFCKKQKRKIISLFAGTILLTMLLSVGCLLYTSTESFCGM